MLQHENDLEFFYRYLEFVDEEAGFEFMYMLDDVRTSTDQSDRFKKMAELHTKYFGQGKEKGMTVITT